MQTFLNTIKLYKGLLSVISYPSCPKKDSILTMWFLYACLFSTITLTLTQSITQISNIIPNCDRLGMCRTELSITLNLGIDAKVRGIQLVIYKTIQLTSSMLLVLLAYYLIS